MARDNKAKKGQQIAKHARKSDDKNRKRKSNGSSDDDDDDAEKEEDEEEQEEDDEEMTELEYRKFLSTMFPSKNMDKKVKAGDKLKAALENDLKNNTKNKKNKKVVEKEKEKEKEDEEEIWETDDDEDEKVSKKKNKKSVGKKNNKNKKKIVESDSDSDYVPSSASDYDYEDEEEESSEDDCDDENCKKKGSGKVNIVFTIGGMDEDDYEDDYEDDDEAEEDDSDTEDEDASVSSDDDEDGEHDDDDEGEDDSVDDKLLTRKKSKAVEVKSTTTTKTKGATKKTVEAPVAVAVTGKYSKKDEDVLVALKGLYESNKDSKIIQECINVCEDNIKVSKAKQEKKQKKTKARNLRIFKKITKDKNVMNDFSFYEKLDTDKQKQIIKELREINKITRVEKPYRMTLLELNIPVQFKSAAMKKINSIRYMDPGSGEYYKNKNWIDTFMRIPFGKHDKLPVSIEDGVDKCHEFMEKAAKTLDEAVYGLDATKMQIMQMVGQLVTNPKAVGSSIGLYGPPGTGKTSLIQDGIAKILGRKTVFIPLGGAKDSSYLVGHGFTYEGSLWGKIVQGLIDSQSMSVVFVFDEVDKLSHTEHGDEITGVLTHLIDSTQNDKFHDVYFSEIDFDLSKCMFVFSYNDESLVNPILKDRMYRIKTEGYDQKQKTVISTKYLMPKIREQVKFIADDIIIPDESISHMIEKYCEKEEGVRNLKRCLEIIHTKLNLYRLMKPGSNLFEKGDMSLKVEFPFTVTTEIVDKLIKKNDKGSVSTFNSMYM